MIRKPSEVRVGSYITTLQPKDIVERVGPPRLVVELAPHSVVHMAAEGGPKKRTHRANIEYVCDTLGPLQALHVTSETAYKEAVQTLNKLRQQLAADVAELIRMAAQADAKTVPSPVDGWKFSVAPDRTIFAKGPMKGMELTASPATKDPQTRAMWTLFSSLIRKGYCDKSPHDSHEWVESAGWRRCANCGYGEPT